MVMLPRGRWKTKPGLNEIRERYFFMARKEQITKEAGTKTLEEAFIKLTQTSGE